MKNTSLIINIVLGLAVLILYILHFTANGASTAQEEPTKVASETPEKETKPKTSEKQKAKSTQNNSELRFAYVNSDSLQLNYDYYKAIEKQLESKRQYIESDLKRRQESLQGEAMSFQQSIQNQSITEQQALEMRDNLLKKEQEFMQYGQTQEASLLKEEQNANKKLNENISKYLAQFAAENDYDFIFSYSSSALAVGVLHADDRYDITKDVLEGLNAEYQADKK